MSGLEQPWLDNVQHCICRLCEQCKQGNLKYTMSTRCWLDIRQHHNVDDIYGVTEVHVFRCKQCRYDVYSVSYNNDKQYARIIETIYFSIAISTISMKHRSLDIPLYCIFFFTDGCSIYILSYTPVFSMTSSSPTVSVDISIWGTYTASLMNKLFLWCCRLSVMEWKFQRPGCLHMSFG